MILEEYEPGEVVILVLVILVVVTLVVCSWRNMILVVVIRKYNTILEEYNCAADADADIFLFKGW